MTERRIPAWWALFLALLFATVLSEGQPRIPFPELNGAESAVQSRLRALRRELEQKPSDGSLWGLYGMTLEAHDFTAEAKLAYLRAHGLNAKDFRWPYLYAALQDQNDPADAVLWHQKALRINPAYAPAYVRLGEALERLQRFDEAHSAFEQATRRDSNNPFGPMGLGRLALHRGDLDKAIEHLERARGIEPELKSLLVTLARAYQRSGRRDDARRVAVQARALPRINYRPDPVRAAVKNETADARGELRKARSAQERGELGVARRALEKAISIDPNLATAHFSLAQLLALEGQAEAAVAAAQRALRIDADLPGVSAFLASTLFGLQRFKEAERQALQALDLDPGDAHVLLTLSFLAVNDGRTERAVSLLRRAFDVRPSETATRQLLEALLEEMAASFEEAGLPEQAADFVERLLVLETENGEGDARLAALRNRLAALRD